MRLILVFLLSSLFISCACFQSKCGGGCCGNKNMTEQTTASSYRQLDILQREHGYKNFHENRVIQSEGQFESFLEEVNSFKYWNNKEQFLSGLKGARINFEKENLVIIPMTASSGSDKVTLDIKQESPEKLYLKLNKEVPSGIRTMDMAYHCFAVAFDKTQIETVEFEFDERNVLWNKD